MILRSVSHCVKAVTLGILEMVHIGQTIAARRKEVGFSQPELAERAEIPVSTIRGIEQGRRGDSITVATLTKLAKALATTMEALAAGGDGSPRDGQPKTVPIVGVVAAGAGLDEPAGTTERILLPPEFDGADAVYEVRGQSMVDGHIIEYDRIFVRRGPGCNSGDVVVAWICDYGSVVKKAKVDTARNVTLHSQDDGEDERYPYRMTEADRLYGVVVGLQRSYGATPTKKKGKK